MNYLFIAHDFKQKDNASSGENLLKTKMSYKYNNCNEQLRNKHDLCNNKEIKCIHAESIIQSLQNNENNQKHKKGN